MKKITELGFTGLSFGILAGLLLTIGAAHAQTTPVTPSIPFGAPGTTNLGGGNASTGTSTTGATTTNAVTPGSTTTGTTGANATTTGTYTGTAATSSANTGTSGNASTTTAPVTPANSTGANTGSNTTTPNTSAGTAPTSAAAQVMPMVLNIDQSGNVLLRGTVISSTGNTLTVLSWGNPWTVSIGSGATVAPSGSAVQIPVGDYVGVLGTVSGQGQTSVNATYVRDWTQSSSASTNAASGSAGGTGVSTGTGTTSTGTASTATSGLPAGTTLYTGTVASIDSAGGTLTITGTGGTTYTVSVSPTTTVWNTARTSIPLSSIQQGDSVRIDGTLSGSTITAAVLRDISR